LSKNGGMLLLAFVVWHMQNGKTNLNARKITSHTASWLSSSFWSGVCLKTVHVLSQARCGFFLVFAAW